MARTARSSRARWALALWAALGGPALHPLWILVGAAVFYGSEYGWHRFAFHAPPAPWPWLRKMQHRLHYDHHAEPGRLDLLFLPLWFLAPVLAVNAALFRLIFGAQAIAPIVLRHLPGHSALRMDALCRPYSLPAAHGLGALYQALPPAPSFHQRKSLVRGFQSGFRLSLSHLSRSEDGGEKSVRAEFVRRQERRRVSRSVAATPSRRAPS